MTVVSVLFCLVAGCGSEQPGLPGEEGLPNLAYCDPVTAWEMEWDELEWAVLGLVNEQRAAGAICGNEAFVAAEPLEMSGGLRCAARVHSVDMATQSYFDHTSPDGEATEDRIEKAGYVWQAAGENIAWGHTVAHEVVAEWMASPTHCSNIMSSDFKHIGIGFYPPDGPYWTQTFASPL